MIRAILLCLVCLVGMENRALSQSLKGKRICIDPGHGGTAATDHYRVGKNGEREEWINLRVALMLRKMLQERGAVVFLTRHSDIRVDLAARSKLARDSAADVFVSIHHNATADSSVNFPIIYYHGAASENKAGVQLADDLAKTLIAKFVRKKAPVSIVSDYTIFPGKGAAVLRETYGIPGVLCEASFFTNVKEESRLKKRRHNKREAIAYADALQQFFDSRIDTIKPSLIPLTLPPFAVLQEADRMKPEALEWHSAYQEGKRLMLRGDSASLHKAYELFTQSARSFPDSWVARECHLNRAKLLARMNRHEAANTELLRAREFYIPPSAE